MTISKKQIAKKNIYFILITIIFIGCSAKYVNRPTPGSRAPNTSINYNLYSKLKDIAVVPADESRNDEKTFAKTMRQAMLFIYNKYPKIHNDFNIVDREDIKKIVEEHKLSLSGLIEQGDYNKIGQIARIDGLMICSVDNDAITMYYDIKLISVDNAKIALVSSYEEPLNYSSTSQEVSRRIRENIIRTFKKLKIIN